MHGGGIQHMMYSGQYLWDFYEVLTGHDTRDLGIAYELISIDPVKRMGTVTGDRGKAEATLPLIH